MAPRSSRASGADTDTSMADVSEIRQLPVDPMVCYRSVLEVPTRLEHIDFEILYTTY